MSPYSRVIELAAGNGRRDKTRFTLDALTNAANEAMILGRPEPRRARIEAKRAIDHSKGFRRIISCSVRARLTRAAAQARDGHTIS